MILKERTFPGNVDIFGHMNKKRFFHSELKKSTFSLNFDIFGDMDRDLQIF